MPSRDMAGHEKSHFFPSKIVGILWFVYLKDFKLFISEVVHILHLCIFLHNILDFIELYDPLLFIRKILNGS